MSDDTTELSSKQFFQLSNSDSQSAYIAGVCFRLFGQLPYFLGRMSFWAAFGQGPLKVKVPEGAHARGSDLLQGFSFCERAACRFYLWRVLQRCAVKPLQAVCSDWRSGRVVRRHRGQMNARRGGSHSECWTRAITNRPGRALGCRLARLHY